jgi:AraC-like DNA-binding protein
MASHHYHALPPPPLAPFLECLWLYEGARPAHAKERRLPDGALTLAINLREDVTRISDQRAPDQFQSYRGCVISGARTTFSLLDTSCLDSVMGVQFRPGGAAAFLPLPASELQDETLSLETVWGTEVATLRERLLEARTVAGRFRVLEQALLARLAPTRSEHATAVAYAVQALRAGGRQPSVAAVAEQVGRSQLRFTQIFREQVGLTPKQFARVMRFQRVLWAVERGGPLRWGELAAAHGYFDQAHLIHEFQALSGMTPGAYRGAVGAQRNHVALPE